MKDNIAKIRAFVDLMRNYAISVAYGRQLYAADSALAELERAAATTTTTAPQHGAWPRCVWLPL